MEKPIELTIEEKFVISQEKCEILQMNCQFLQLKQELDNKVVKFNEKIRRNGFVLNNNLEWVEGG
jgi:hypothetical protein